MIAAIFSGGSYRDLEFYRGLIKDADLIIAADSGGEALLLLGVAPDILVGDMDSIGADVFAEITGSGAPRLSRCRRKRTSRIRSLPSGPRWIGARTRS